LDPDQIDAYLAEVLRDDDVFLRAEEDWIDWDDFKKKRSYESLDNFDYESLKELAEKIDEGAYEKTYDVHGCDLPTEMIAKGVNATKVSVKNFCGEIEFLENIGYEDEDFVFVLFRGKSLGKNLVEDGHVVVPEKLLHVFLPKELFDFCDKSFTLL
jgi:hypothetical protein